MNCVSTYLPITLTVVREAMRYNYCLLYIDPSVMTYVIQIVAGVIVAAGAVIGVIWRKTRKKIGKTLNIDENRNKEVESDDIVVREEGTDE